MVDETRGEYEEWLIKWWICGMDEKWSICGSEGRMENARNMWKTHGGNVECMWNICEMDNKQRNVEQRIKWFVYGIGERMDNIPNG